MPPGVEVCACGLGFPEGAPVFAEGGKVVFVEIHRGQVTAWDRSSGKCAVVARTGGGPNAVIAAEGFAGAAWLVTQNGGVAGAWRSAQPRIPGIQTVGPDGSVQYLCTVVDGRQLAAPNDLCLDVSGTLFFTDPGEAFSPEDPREDGYLFAVGPDGTERSWNVGRTFPNGIACVAGEVVWTESYTCRVMGMGNGARRVVAQLPRSHVPDGLGARADGLVAVTTTASGGVVLLTQEGQCRFIRLGEGVYTTNCKFNADGDLYVTDAADGSSEVPSGRLWRISADAVNEAVRHGEVVK